MNLLLYAYNEPAHHPVIIANIRKERVLRKHTHKGCLCFSMFLVCMERDSRYFHQWSNQHSRPWLPRPKRQGFGRVAGFPSLGRNYWLEKTGNCLKLLERLEVRKSQMNSSFEMQCVLAKNMSKDYSSSILFIQYRTWRSHNVTSLSLTRYALGKKTVNGTNGDRQTFRSGLCGHQQRCQCSKNVQTCDVFTGTCPYIEAMGTCIHYSAELETPFRIAH